MGLGRIELPTSPLSGVRSSQLSYRPVGLRQSWWSWSGSNRRPPECKSGALPTELQPLVRKTNRGRLDARDRGPAPIPLSTSDKSSPLPCGCGSETPSRDSERSSQPAAYCQRIAVMEWNDCRRVLCRRLHPRSLRKEVIQPQVLLRLPCYDFTPIMNHTLGRCLPCGLARRLLVQSTFVM